MLLGIESSLEEQIVLTSQIIRVMLTRIKTVGDRLISMLMKTSNRSSYLLFYLIYYQISWVRSLINLVIFEWLLVDDRMFLNVNYNYLSITLFLSYFLCLLFHFLYFYLFIIFFLIIIQQFMNIFLKFQGETSILQPSQLQYLINQNQKHGRSLIFISNGKLCDPLTNFEDHQIVYAYAKLLGGKGGFGAKLKTQGGKKVRPNENMYSRDIQGQPVAYSTMTRQYEEYYKKKLEDDQKVSKQLAQFQIVSNTYRQDYASTKLDHSYNAEMVENQKRLLESMKIGIKKYLQKKQQHHSKGSQFQPQVDFGQVSQKQKKQQKNDEQNQPVKRSRPLDKDQIQQQSGKPVKKVKPNEEQVQQQKKTQKIQKPPVKVQINPNIKFLSAKQKLKSLFKK